MEDSDSDGCESNANLMRGGRWNMDIGVESIWDDIQDVDQFIGAFLYHVIHESLHGSFWEAGRIVGLESEYAVYSMLNQVMTLENEQFYKRYYSGCDMSDGEDSFI